MNNTFMRTDRVVQNLQKILQTEKEAIWTSNPYVSEETLQHLWYQRRSQLAAYFHVHDGLSQEIQMSIVPRTIPDPGHSVVRQASAPGHPHLCQSTVSLSQPAPLSGPIPRPCPAPMAETSTRGGAPIPFSQQAYGKPVSRLQSSSPVPNGILRATEPTYTYCCIGSGSSTMPSLGEMDIREPLDYESATSDSFGGSGLPPHVQYALGSFDARQLGLPDVPPNPLKFEGPRNISNVDSRSTSIQTIGELTTESSLADEISGQNNFTCSSIGAAFPMLRVRSDVSNFSNFNGGGEVSPPRLISPLWQANDSSIGWAGNEQFPIFNHAACVGQHAFSSSTFPSCSFVDVSQERSPVLEEDMKCSAFAENNSPSMRPANISRQQKRIAHGARRIAPKLSDTDSLIPKTQPVYLKLKRIREDGTSKEVVAIQKTPYIRPTYPKKRCFLCTDHSEGFRGEHELRRHHERAHSTRRKMWMTVDVSGTNWLGKCKACSSGKKYGAYYNAAAHLRRAHFNPRKRGRGLVKCEEKRGGKGGGDYPPMDVLKKNWLKEVDVIVPNYYVERSDEEDFDTEDSSLIPPLGCSTTPDSFDFSSPAAPIERDYDLCPDDAITTQLLNSYRPSPNAFMSYSHHNDVSSLSMRTMHESIGDITAIDSLPLDNQPHIMDFDSQFNSYPTAPQHHCLTQHRSTMFGDSDLFFTIHQ